MRAIVLRDFPYSKDGIHIETLTKDAIFECRSDISAGLLAEKYIAEAPEDAVLTAKTDLPDDVLALVTAADEADLLAKNAREEAKSKPKDEKQAAFKAVKALDEAAAAARTVADDAIAALSAA
jgi:hypothetical protein